MRQIYTIDRWLPAYGKRRNFYASALIASADHNPDFFFRLWTPFG
jgi:hypothetical protein